MRQVVYVSRQTAQKGGSAAPMTCFSRQSGCTRSRLDTFRVSPSPNGNRCKATPLISTNASIMGTEIVTAHSVRLFHTRVARPYDSPLIWLHHLYKRSNREGLYFLPRAHGGDKGTIALLLFSQRGRRGSTDILSHNCFRCRGFRR